MNAKQREKKEVQNKASTRHEWGMVTKRAKAKKEGTLNRSPKNVAKKVSKSWLVVVYRVRDKVWSGGGVRGSALGLLWPGCNKGETWLPPGRLVEQYFFEILILYINIFFIIF